MLTVMTDQIILTQDGKTKIELELKELKNVRMPEIIEKIEQAKELGDLSENAEYHDAKDQQGLIASRIAEIEDILKKAVISDSITTKEIISMGSGFVVEDASGKRKELTLVGFNEADPANGRISNVSPMGMAFNQRRVGDTVEVETPKGTVVYKIVEIK
jgi:transcription elongation factor GreA